MQVCGSCCVTDSHGTIRLPELDMPRGAFLGTLRELRAEAAPLHPQGLQQPRAHEGFPTLAGDLLDQVAHDHIHQIIVLEPGAYIFVGRKVAQSRAGFRPREVRGVPEHIMARQSRVVRKQVSHRKPLGGHRVVQTEGRQDLVHRAIPVQLPFLHQETNRGGREGFRTGGDEEASVIGNSLGLPQPADAKTLGVHHLPLMHHPNGRPRNVPFLQAAQQILIEAGQKILRIRLEESGA